MRVVVLALAQTQYLSDIVRTLRELGVALSVPPARAQLVAGGDCVYVYDTERELHAHRCEHAVRLRRNEDPLLAVAAILSRYLEMRHLRVGVDVGRALTAVYLVNSKLLGSRTFTSVEELEAFTCQLADALRPHSITINIGVEGARRASVELPDAICGVEVRFVSERRTNSVVTPLHGEASLRGGRKRDLAAALNIALS